LCDGQARCLSGQIDIRLADGIAHIGNAERPRLFVQEVDAECRVEPPKRRLSLGIALEHPQFRVDGTGLRQYPLQISLHIDDRPIGDLPIQPLIDGQQLFSSIIIFGRVVVLLI
jgi:hypothetical protein